jgi:hypothetical protein
MATWANRLYEYVPPVTAETGKEVVVTTTYEPNVIVDSGTVLGDWDLGTSSFSKAKSEKSALSLSGKGRLISVDIRNKEDHPCALLGLGVIFKVKKP